uniref:CARM1 n=1 Tax=Arundo donax TaxID=35708 RepID=A0A0A9DIW3_ARUDO
MAKCFQQQEGFTWPHFLMNTFMLKWQTRHSSGSSTTFLVLILRLYMIQPSRDIFHSLLWMHLTQDY